LEPVAQVMLQAVPLQVGVPFAVVGQAVHDVPQVAVLLLDTQAPEQMW
jgi:hypothetical protein